MKNKVVLGLSALLLTSVAYSQSVESDDMYFTSKDRAKLKEAQATQQAAYEASARNKKRSDLAVAQEDVDSDVTYSARNENPEFAARSNSQTAQADNQDYFVNDYKYQNYSNLNNFNNNFNDWYGSSWYRPNYYTSSIYGWNSPYYGSAYDVWGNPWMNPYYRSGWSSSFSFHMGNSWNYGWGNNMGWGMSYGYGNPYMGSMFGFGSGFGYGYGGYGGWYNSPNVIIINNGEGGRNVAYGKRGSHGGMITSRDGYSGSRSRGSNVATPSGNGSRPTYGNTGNSGGRVATTLPTRSNNNRSTRQEEYYNRSWRNSQQPASGSYSAPSRSSQSDNGWNRSSNSDFGRSSTSPSYNSSGNVRSGSSDGGARTSSPASSGSNGRTRGRD
jgi:hypothetical protein